jgi:PilZ domain
MATQCTVTSCNHRGCVSLEGDDLCRSHFIARCYSRLEECSAQIKNHQSSGPVIGQSLTETLSGIASQVAALGLAAKDLEAVEQAQLLDILFTAAHLMQSLRRSGRKHLSVPLRLRYETAEKAWTEEATTHEVSFHGASVRSRLPIRKGELISVERVDMSRQAEAKVKWQRRNADGSQTLGIEFLSNHNFWETEL